MELLPAPKIFDHKHLIDDVIFPRPAAIGYIDSNRVPVRLHYQRGVDPLFAIEMLGYVETAWEKLFITGNFMAPHPDGTFGGNSLFDIYIVTNLSPGVGGMAGFSGYYEPTSRIDAISYVVFNHVIVDRLRRGVVAHELFHSAQLAYDFWEPLGVQESTAVWASYHVFPEEDMVWRYFTFYNDTPYFSLANPSAYYQYGSGMAMKFLDEKFSTEENNFIAEIWAGTPQDTFDNEPDFLDVIEKLLISKGTSFIETFRELGAWRLFVGSRNDGQHFRDADKWNGWTRSMEPYIESESSGKQSIIMGEAIHGLQPFSHGFLSFKRPDSEEGRFSLTVNISGNSRYSLDVYVRNAEGLWQKRASQLIELQAQQEMTSEMSLEFSKELGDTEIVGIISNLAYADYDVDALDLTKSEYSYEFRKLVK